MCDAYELVLDAMLVLLDEPRTDEWLAEKMGVRGVQIKDWLARAMNEGRIQRLRRPTRYVAEKLPLFKQ